MTKTSPENIKTVHQWNVTRHQIQCGIRELKRHKLTRDEELIVISVFRIMMAAAAGVEKPAIPKKRKIDMDGLVQILNKARCLEKRVIGNYELAGRIVDFLEGEKTDD